ncbi:MAG TPA: DUF6055 domain-containing protein [Phycisphaerae bacterium]|nr:DUF6055 domain-containing protein [Phycisphaerae bacterium]HRY68198.1 DUF6055 domain-containing protein [Phycisphaerae bacterium]HSA27096.1 DUF6055 domain-containing protein [Phycisphaerae bacterium]
MSAQSIQPRAIRFLLLPVMSALAVVFLWGCPSAGPVVDDRRVLEPIRDMASLDAWMDATAGAPASIETPASTRSSDLIRRAYQAGSITEEHRCLLEVQAAYHPEQLDPVYRGDPDPGIDDTSLLREIRLRLPSFSPATQEALRPYTLSFEDPESAFYHGPVTAARTVTSRQVCGTSAPGKTSVRNAMIRPAPDGSYFVITAPAGTERQRDIILEAFETAYPMYVGLGFTEPTDFIRVELTEQLPANIYGREWMSHLEAQERCHIQIRHSLDDDRLRATAVHELFHCFQDYTNTDYIPANARWLWESTATWAQEFVYPDTNTEHEYDPSGFSNLTREFFSQEGTLEYSSYLYWFFLYQRQGKTGAIVHDLYRQIYRDGIVPALTSSPIFQSEFKEFALWNLNTPPYKYYQDASGAPIHSPSGYSLTRHRVRSNTVDFQGVFAYSGGMRYLVYTFDDDVDRVVFDLRAVRKRDDNQWGIQAVYRVGGNWLHRDVSSHDELVFCRGREAERVTGLILILSTGELDETRPNAELSGTVSFDTQDVCVPQWRGYVECTWNASGPGNGREDEGVSLQPGDYTWHGTTRSEETLIHDEEGGSFYILEQTITTSSEYEWYATHEPPESELWSYTAWERRVEHVRGNRTTTHERMPECPPSNCSTMPRRIHLRSETEEDPVFVFTGLYFTGLGTYVSTYTSYHVVGTLEIMQGHVSEVRTDEDEHGISTFCPSLDMELRLSEDHRILSGSSEGPTRSCRAEYRFE